MVHNIYQESKGFGSKTILTPEQDTALRLEEFMERRYEFRYNTVLNDLEYRQRNSIHSISDRWIGGYAIRWRLMP